MAIFMASIFLCSPALAANVTVGASMQPEKGSTTLFTLAVTFDIKPGWHTYDEIGKGSEVPTSIESELPEGVKAVGEWQRPISMESKDAVDKTIYEGQVEFTRTVAVDANAQGKQIELTVRFQACTDQVCNRPQKKKLSVQIPKTSRSNTIFEPPVQLTVEDKPLNAVAKQRFPSPALFDVDGDGQIELVTGSLMGSVRVYENSNPTGKGDPAWAPSTLLKDADGKPIRTSNW